MDVWNKVQPQIAANCTRTPCLQSRRLPGQRPGSATRLGNDRRRAARRLKRRTSTRLRAVGIRADCTCSTSRATIIQEVAVSCSRFEQLHQHLLVNNSANTLRRAQRRHLVHALDPASRAERQRSAGEKVHASPHAVAVPTIVRRALAAAGRRRRPERCRWHAGRDCADISRSDHVRVVTAATTSARAPGVVVAAGTPPGRVHRRERPKAFKLVKDRTAGARCRFELVPLRRRSAIDAARTRACPRSRTDSPTRTGPGPPN